MLVTLLLLAATAPAEGAKDKAPPAKKELFADQKWYKDQEGKEQTFEGTLRHTPLPDGVATIGRHNDFQLEMTVKGRKEVREVYVGGKPELLKPYAGRKVKLTGKPVELEVVGKVHREIWPARVELVAVKAGK